MPGGVAALLLVGCAAGLVLPGEDRPCHGSVQG